MLSIYFVRHAEPDHSWKEDATRPLTQQGTEDTLKVLDFFKDFTIDRFYCSPYIRSLDTISSTAAYFQSPVIQDYRLREREKGPDGNQRGMIQLRWKNLNYHEPEGESIQQVQDRNMEVLGEILQEYGTKEGDYHIVIGTHGTALSGILRYYDGTYNCDSFFRMVDWMPYIIRLDFQGDTLVGKEELFHLERPFHR